MPKQAYYDRANEPVGQLSEDQKYQLLANSRRRAIIHELHADAPLSKKALADRITDREHREGESWSDARKRVYISLHQQHIPKLTKLDVVREGEEGLVLGPNAGKLVEELEDDGRRGLRDRVGSVVKGFS